MLLLEELPVPTHSLTPAGSPHPPLLQAAAAVPRREPVVSKKEQTRNQLGSGFPALAGCLPSRARGAPSTAEPRGPQRPATTTGPPGGAFCTGTRTGADWVPLLSSRRPTPLAGPTPNQPLHKPGEVTCLGSLSSGGSLGAVSSTHHGSQAGFPSGLSSTPHMLPPVPHTPTF